MQIFVNCSSWKAKVGGRGDNLCDVFLGWTAYNNNKSFMLLPLYLSPSLLPTADFH